MFKGFWGAWLWKYWKCIENSGENKSHFVNISVTKAWIFMDGIWNLSSWDYDEPSTKIHEPVAHNCAQGINLHACKNKAFVGLGSWKVNLWICEMAKASNKENWSVQLVRPACPSSWFVQLVRPAGPSSWFVQLVLPAGLSSWSVQLVCPAGMSSWYIQLVRPAGTSSWYIKLVCLADQQCCKVSN